MDDLAAALAGSFQVTPHQNNPAAPHPRFSDYKIKTNVPNQEVRRERILTRQKQSRFDYQNHIRRLAEGDWKDLVEEDEEVEDGDEDMDVEVKSVAKPGRYYKNQLMLSEWMMEKPEDFESEWIMVPCPVGKRNLVVTHKGETKAYSRSGYRIETFPSHLPGGCRSKGKFHNAHTILDCIFSETTKTFYILDVMCWQGHPVYDSETEFRFYWLQTKMEEFPSLKEWTKTNKYRFEPVPNFPCTEDSIATVMATPMNIQMDGLLYYHKHTRYTFGPTPLVVWLKPYMLPDMLGIPVHPKYIEDKPASYTGLADHFEKVKKDKIRKEETKNSPSPRKPRPTKSGTGMEISESVEVTDTCAETSVSSTDCTAPEIDMDPTQLSNM